MRQHLGIDLRGAGGIALGEHRLGLLQDLGDVGLARRRHALGDLVDEGVDLALGIAPMKPSAGWPLTKAITAGIDWMPIWPGIAGCWSMFILTSLTLPLALRTAFSRIGVSCGTGRTIPPRSRSAPAGASTPR
jgi:hypothetical protein